jgi:hypothetical protein
MKTKKVSAFVAGIFFLLISSNSGYADETTIVSHVLKVVVVGAGVVSAGENRCAGHCSFQYSTEKPGMDFRRMGGRLCRPGRLRTCHGCG